MKAPAAEQRTLLVIAEIDIRLGQLRHRAAHLPVADRLAELDESQSAISRQRLESVSELEAVQREMSRLESDVATVRQRLSRDEARAREMTNLKDANALESERENLTARLSVLEHEQLQLLQRWEDAEAALAEYETELVRRSAVRASLEAERDAELAALAAEQGELDDQRRAETGTVDGELLALYERLRARSGRGAALLRQKTCGACTMALTGSDVEATRRLAADEVAQCPSCDAILVRTEESGLG